MKIARYWRLIIPLVAIAVSVGLCLWCIFPGVRCGLAFLRLNGQSSGRDWSFSMYTYSDKVTNSQISQYYSEGCGRLADLESERRTYTYEDAEGYMGCITVVQHATSYEFVRVFGGNDSDIIEVGRRSGVFPSERYLRVIRIRTDELPSGVIRPW